MTYLSDIRLAVKANYCADEVSQASFPFSEAYLKKVDPDKPFTLQNKKPTKQQPHKRKNNVLDEEEAANGPTGIPSAGDDEENAMNATENERNEEKGKVYGEPEAIDVPLRPEEKRRLNWEGGRYLAPLTTVGNLVGLPFPSPHSSFSFPAPPKLTSSPSSHSAASVLTTAPPSPSPKWLSPNPSSTALKKNGLSSVDTRAKRCLVSKSPVGSRTGWYPPRKSLRIL